MKYIFATTSILVVASHANIVFSQTEGHEKFQIGLTGGASIPLADYADTNQEWEPDRGYATPGVFIRLEGNYWIKSSFGVGLAAGWLRNGFAAQHQPCSSLGQRYFNGLPWKIFHVAPTLSGRTKGKIKFVGNMGAGLAFIQRKGFYEEYDGNRCSEIYDYQDFPSKVTAMIRAGVGTEVPVSEKLRVGINAQWFYTAHRLNGTQRSGHRNVTELISGTRSDIDISVLNISLAFVAAL